MTDEGKYFGFLSFLGNNSGVCSTKLSKSPVGWVPVAHNGTLIITQLSVFSSLSHSPIVYPWKLHAPRSLFLGRPLRKLKLRQRTGGSFKDCAYTGTREKLTGDARELRPETKTFCLQRMPTSQTWPHSRSTPWHPLSTAINLLP